VFLTYKKEKYGNIEATQNVISVTAQDIQNIINQKYGCKIDAASGNEFNINSFPIKILGEEVQDKSILVDDIIIRKISKPDSIFNSVSFLDKPLPQNINIDNWDETLRDFVSNGIAKSGKFVNAMIYNNRISSNPNSTWLNRDFVIDNNTNTIYNTKYNYALDDNGSYSKLDRIPEEIDREIMP
jgi:hypothetical protein